MKKILLLLLICCSFNASGQKPLSDYNWRQLKPVNNAVARHENAFVEFDEKFYLIGGRGVKPVEVFDPKVNKWTKLKSTPFEVHHFQAVVYGDAIYVVCAQTGGYPKETALEYIWKYYPKEDRWEKGEAIPKEMQRGSAGVVIYDDKLYVVGGIELGHTSGTTNRFDYFDLKTNKWTALTKAPHLRDHIAAVVVNDKLYCIGGRNTSVHHPDNFVAFFAATLSEVDVYDFLSKKWTTLKNPLPVPTAAGGVAVLDNKILYFGGEGERNTAYDETQCLDLESGIWTKLSSLNIGRHGSAAIVFDNKIWIAAGSPNQGGGNINSIEVFE